jgi:hypothetical protein
VRQRGQGLSQRRIIYASFPFDPFVEGRPLDERDGEDLLGQLFDAVSLEEAASNARFAKSALIAVRKVASVGHDPRGRTHSA